MAIARVRVLLKPSRKGPEIDFKIMHQEFKRRVDDAGIKTELKAREFFESKRRKNRLKKLQAVQRRKEDDVEAKLARGEKVDGNAKIVKKIRTRIKARKLREKKDSNREFRTKKTY